MRKNRDMRILYFDCPTGVSGDMLLASLIDMGVDRSMILKEVRKLPVERVRVETRKETRHSITGTTFRVKFAESHHHRTFKDIRSLIRRSALAPEVKDLSVRIFRAIAEAEGKVHGISPERVHFHEVGAVDSIVDIVGAAAALKSLGSAIVHCSPLPLGSGTAKTMHGVIPIPAPATVEILKGSPVASSSIPFELTTPTGAAIMKTIAASFGPMPAMVMERTGYGAGKKDFREAANVMRAVFGSTAEAQGGGSERLFVMETNIDDMSPQLSGYLMERLLAAGALDAYYTPVQMKKSRPAVVLTVLTDEERRDALMDLIFSESTSIGVRSWPVERRCLERKTVKVRTRYGSLPVKVSFLGSRPVNIQPEYEAARAAAAKKGAPLKAVMDEARAACADIPGKEEKASSGRRRR